ncbi:tyrosine-type recombinase/integrase [Desulfotomaculum sp. 1211_IL3151]|uniref:tyrosine-type recombinase/integrase n=1 Tax=Desulfotomaculum sp. 1211_IL3151 TaxID=3084055 RepID=UPI002FD96530
MAHYYKPNCKCPKDAKKCTCGATWSYIVDVGINPKNGRRKQKKKGGFKTKKEAEQEVAKIVVGMAKGKSYVQESNITFKDFSKIWLDTYKSTKNKKVSTIITREYQLKNLMPYFEHLKMRDISGLEYQDMLNDLKAKEYSDNTISGIHSVGVMIFKKAKKSRVVFENPTELAILPKTAVTVQDIEKGVELPKYLEKEELALLLKAAKEKGLPQDYEVFRLLAFSGMRLGELCVLKWSDLNFEDNTIRITKTYFNPTNNMLDYKLLTPKTKTSIRTIDMDKSVMEDLKRLKAKQSEFRIKHADSYHNEGFVFVNMERNYGYPRILKIFEKRMTRLLKLAKLNQKLTPHSLRHTHTSLLAEAGASLDAIMERLGHKDNATTRNIYLHVTKAVKKETSQKFSELMNGL